MFTSLENQIPSTLFINPIHHNLSFCGAKSSIPYVKCDFVKISCLTYPITKNIFWLSMKLFYTVFEPSGWSHVKISEFYEINARRVFKGDFINQLFTFLNKLESVLLSKVCPLWSHVSFAINNLFIDPSHFASDSVKVNRSLNEISRG